MKSVDDTFHPERGHDHWICGALSDDYEQRFGLTMVPFKTRGRREAKKALWTVLWIALLIGALELFT